MNFDRLPSELELSVLLIEDDVELCTLMREFFAPRGIRIEAAHDGRRGPGRRRLPALTI